MPLSEWTRMAIASAVAVIAVSFLVIDAAVDVNSSVIVNRIEIAEASIANAAMSQRQLSSAVRAWGASKARKNNL